MNKIKENIKYTKEKWAKYLRCLGSFLYTERIHYYCYYIFLNKNYKSKLNINTVLLDIGFGSGFNIYKISKKYGIKTIGLDIVEDTVNFYNKKKIKNSYAIKIDPLKNRIPLGKEEVNFIICSHVLEHVPDDKYMLKEIYRVLKKNGIVYFNIPINEEDFEVPNHLRKYTPKTFRDKLLKNNFKFIKCLESDNFTLFITCLGIRRNLFSNILKKLLILFLSFVPIIVLEKFHFRKSQYVCFAKK